MYIVHGHVVFWFPHIKGRIVEHCVVFCLLPQAHEGELSILILYRCLFRRQCLVRRPVICWFGPICPMCDRICLTGKGGEGGFAFSRDFFPLESLSSHIESHWHLPLLFSLSFHFLGFCSKLVSIARQLGDIGKAFLASCQVR